MYKTGAKASVCLEFVLSNKLLLNLARNGRDSLIANLTPDETQVFRNGGLLDKLPNLEIVRWWDYLRLQSKKDLDEKLLNQGREAEQWTLNEEIKILSTFTELKPQLVALDSDYLGYDILSYIKSKEGSIYAIQIEVKSYSAKSYPHFYITQNEWNKALPVKERYLMYVWCIETREFRNLTLEEIEFHIPKNMGEGEWQNVLIENY